MLYILALLIGVIAGLRAMTAPAAVAWGAYLGWLPVAGTWASFMSHWAAVGIFTILAIVELITDQLPSTPSRKVPQQFGARILLGAFSGAVIGAAGGATIVCLIAGFGKDPPAAFIEDAVAIIGGLLIVAAVA
ncbi:MAG: DUF4126 domain-containing protein [Mesorhizobium sp.]|nr:MAG: DUF4126 domain-containing protein [Mesorhizobium sp.]